MQKNIQDKFEALTGREQLIRRPQMWIGSMDPVTQPMFVVEDDKVVRRDVTFIPAFRKIIDEILDNSIDALIEHSSSTGTIKVKMDDEKVSVEDDGVGIPVQLKVLNENELKNLPPEEAKKLKSSYIPEIAWTRLFSGTNFQDSADRKTIGSHGLGSKCASIFSTKFIGKTDDGKKSCTVTAVNNLESSKCKVSHSSGHSGTYVEFYPDVKRFKLSKVEQVYHDLMYQRLICLSITFPNIKFSFNGRRINLNDKKFLKMFSDDIEMLHFDNGFVGVFPNDSDEFSFFTYVNGMNMSRGGSHVEHIAFQIVNPIREKLERKYRAIKPGDIKNRLTLVVFMRDFANPKFDSQTKETLTNSIADVAAFLKGIDFERFAKQVLKNDAIIEPIIETFKIKEELKARQELKKVKKAKVKSDKYLSPTDSQNCLYLCEGHSAMASLASCLGRTGNGFYACRGLSINVLTNSIQKIAANQEFKDIMNILNLDVSDSSDTKKDMSFDKVVIAVDADLDGIHLGSMLIGWFRKFAPNLFEEGRICKLQTPLVIVKDAKGNIKDYFFDLDAFKKWEAKNPNTKLNIVYQKGLGSMERSDIDWLIANKGQDSLIYSFEADKHAFANVDLWLGNEAEPRKEKLKQYTFDINLV